MNIPDEAVQAAMLALAEANVPVDVQECLLRGYDKMDVPPNALKSALTAALPFLQGVKVKALAWHDLGGFSTAPSGFARYSIIKVHNGKGDMSWSLEINSRFSSKHDTLKAAKTAAQSDYEARILSAIEPSPSPRAQALEEARRQAIEDVLGALTAHELYQYRPKAFQGFIDYARNELSPQPVAGGWQPIETAPKGTAPHHWDAPSILVSDGQSVDQAEWEADDGEPYWHATGGKRKSGNFLGYEPTHWRPLPASPEVSG